ncbi:MAG: EamA/RhaT family transporter, partial [Deltaproteobacteria bacterium]
MDRTRGFSLGLVSAALFGVATPVSKQLLSDISPLVLAGLLYLGAALALLPAVLRSPRSSSIPKDRTNRLRLSGAVFFGGIVGPVLLLLGLELSLSASVAMLLSLETVATAVLAYFFFREHLGRWTWAASVGVVLASALLAFEGGRPSIVGALLVAGACVAWGLDNNLTALIDGITPTESTFWKGLAAGIVNLSLGLILSPGAIGGAWLWALLVGGLSYGVSITLYIHSAQILGATRSQMVFACAPVFGVAGSILWLGESMSLLQAVAAGLLAVALTMLFLERHEHAHVHEALEHVHSHRHDDDHHDHSHSDLADDVRHSHVHSHERVEHSHPHWPDLHHRH